MSLRSGYWFPTIFLAILHAMDTPAPRGAVPLGDVSVCVEYRPSVHWLSIARHRVSVSLNSLSGNADKHEGSFSYSLTLITVQPKPHLKPVCFLVIVIFRYSSITAPRPRGTCYLFSRRSLDRIQGDTPQGPEVWSLLWYRCTLRRVGSPRKIDAVKMCNWDTFLPKLATRGQGLLTYWNSSHAVMVSFSARRMSDSLECEVCMERFEQRSRRPKLLACGHTVCLVCVVEMHRKAVPGTNSFLCPMDRKVI